ncbi:MAG: LPP20 family lipoprotein [Prevotellaceae bacterium]|jgi:L-amino acid N-acyltransferase YncA|nr:LPP20 family lipoprotein [Prevotellaceae bacterium]
MMHKIFTHIIPRLLLAACFPASVAWSQSISEIKRSDQYYWGESNGKTVTLAETQALSMLIGQISVSVESKFSQLKEELIDKNQSEFKEQFSSVVSTYSSATIRNTERVTDGEEPNVYVFLYVKRSEVYKIFEERKLKIKDFVKTAGEVERQLQIADALKYCYWALMLLRSHPDGNAITCEVEGREEILAVYLPKKINSIFTGLKFEVADKEEEPNRTIYQLAISYRGQPVSNCDYTVYDGRNWSEVVSAKDGTGVAEILGNASMLKNIGVNVEIHFSHEWNTDAEVKDIMDKVSPVTFPKRRFNVSASKSKQASVAAAQSPGKEALLDRAMQEEAEDSRAAAASVVASVTAANDAAGKGGGAALRDQAVSEAESKRYLSLLRKVEAAIRSRQYEAAQRCFTPEGYDIYTRLVKYGNAAIVGKASYSFLKFEDGVLARSLPMRFNFSGANRRVFVEDIVFDISQQEGKIRSLSFGLSQQECSEIMQRKMWSPYSRLAIINFLENYKTAYALKRLDYIQSIFSDNALIIVGKVVKVDPSAENRFTSKRIQQTQYTKAQYIKQLGGVFRSNEYVNLKFTDVNVKKAGIGGEVYGIQVSQRYYSTSYGDTGYLFLVTDLNNPNKPVIHVRTWQPEKDPNFGVYDLSHF